MLDEYRAAKKGLDAMGAEETVLVKTEEQLRSEHAVLKRKVQQLEAATGISGYTDVTQVRGRDKEREREREKERDRERER